MSSGKPERGISWKSVGVTLGALGAAGFAFQYMAEEQRRQQDARSEGTVTGKALIGGPFSLFDVDGNMVTNDDLKGQFTLVYFGFTYCPDICPSELAKMDRVVTAIDDKFGPVLRPVMISVDPRRDSLTQMKHYAKDFHPRMLCLAGTPTQVEKAARAYRVFFSKVDAVDEDDMDYVVDHSIVMYLMDKNGEFLEFFTQMAQPEEMIRKISDLISKNK